MAVGTPVSQGNSSTCVCPVTGAGSGDIVILGVSLDVASVTSFGWPSGFTELAKGNLTVDGHAWGLAWKRLTGTDSGTYTITVSTGGNNVCFAIPLTGRHATNPPVAGTGTTNNTSNTSPITITAPGVTAIAGDDILHVALPDVSVAGGGNGFSAWALGTEILDVEGPSSALWSNVGVAKAENVGAGATGSKTTTFALSTGASGWWSGLIRVPAAAGGGPQSFSQSSTDSIAMSDSVSRSVVESRSTGDSVAVSESLGRTSAQARATSDAVAMSDSLSRGSMSSSRSTSDSIALTNALSKISTFARSMSDSIAVSDVLGGAGVSRPRGIADSIAVSDSLSRGSTSLPRSIANSVSLSDVISRVIVFARAMSDSMSVSDVLTRVSSRSRSSSDSVVLSDAVARAMSASRSLAESILLSDTLNRSALITARASSDSIAVSDVVSRSGTGGSSQSSSDSISISDVSTRSSSKSRSLSDSVAMSDSLARGAVALPRSLNNSVAVSDALNRAVVRFMATSDSIVVATSLSRIVANSRSSSDSMTVSAVLARSVGYVRTPQNTISVSDLVARGVLSMTRSISDSINFFDDATIPVVTRKIYPEAHRGSEITGLSDRDENAVTSTRGDLVSSRSARPRVGGTGSQSSSVSSIGTRT